MNNEIHERATDLVVKALQLNSNHRIELVNAVLKGSPLSDRECKQVHELVRKACEMREKLAIGLHHVELVAPRPLALNCADMTPEDCRYPTAPLKEAASRKAYCA